MLSLKPRTIEPAGNSTILQRIRQSDVSAVKDCLDAYGNFVWTLARKLTRSREEAETATEEIFTDIWRYRDRPPSTQSMEKDVITMIAVRRLLQGLQPMSRDSIARMDLPN